MKTERRIRYCFAVRKSKCTEHNSVGDRQRAPERVFERERERVAQEMQSNTEEERDYHKIQREGDTECT